MPSPQDKLACSVFALGLYLSFIQREAVVRWADRRIGEIDLAPEWLIEISLSQSKHLLDLISDLKHVGGEIDPVTTCKAAFALLPDVTNLNFDDAAGFAKRMYRIAYQALQADRKKPLLSTTDKVADNFAFARVGYGGVTEQLAMEFFRNFVQDHRDGGVVALLRPVVWSISSQEVENVGDVPADRILHVGLASWIIQDGNYGDFSVGDKAQFALEFYSEKGLLPVIGGPPRADLLAASRYSVRGRVIFSNPEVWVIDFGRFVAYQQQKPPEHASVGEFVEGEMFLGIDPFFYFEQLTFIDGMPFLSYRWTIRSIWRETTPWIEVTVPAGRPCLARDRSRESFVPVGHTTAWDEDDGNAEYVLECTMIGGPTAPSSA